jgi:DNA topoisomerase-1
MTRLRKSRPYRSLGYSRVTTTTTARYLDEAGTGLSPTERERVVALVIPPAWSNVWISARADAHILAVGDDAAGRRQYIYHPVWRAKRDMDKFARALRLAVALPAARGQVTRDLRRGELDRSRVLAGAFRMLDSTAIRAGGEEYASAHGSRGLATLQRRHVTVAGGNIALRFPSKSGQRAEKTFHDVELARLLVALGAGTGSARLFVWRNSGRKTQLTSHQLNGYVKARVGESFTAKDFRTLAGSLAAARSLALARHASSAHDRAANVRVAIAAAADLLGNTPTIARTSYIDPAIFTLYEKGEVMVLRGSAERALIHLLRPRS